LVTVSAVALQSDATNRRQFHFVRPLGSLSLLDVSLTLFDAEDRRHGTSTRGNHKKALFLQRYSCYTSLLLCLASPSCDPGSYEAIIVSGRLSLTRICTKYTSLLFGA
jgi:hypothetical protein